MLTIVWVVGEAATLVLRGTITGGDLQKFADALDRLAGESASTVRIDLAGVDSWSLVAQGMVLSTAERVSDRGGHLVLCRPSATLRRRSRRLSVFDRVTTVVH